jgi:hypothetical protein
VARFRVRAGGWFRTAFVFRRGFVACFRGRFGGARCSGGARRCAASSVGGGGGRRGGARSGGCGGFGGGCDVSGGAGWPGVSGGAWCALRTRFKRTRREDLGQRVHGFGTHTGADGARGGLFCHEFFFGGQRFFFGAFFADEDEQEQECAAGGDEDPFAVAGEPAGLPGGGLRGGCWGRGCHGSAFPDGGEGLEAALA